jgi:hypothetical protein
MATSYPADNGSYIGSDGVIIPVDSLAASYTYNTDGTLATSTVVFNGNTYIQSYSYVSGRVSAVSQWVKQ